MPAVVLITDSQQFEVTVSGGVDKRGNAAPLDGSPTFSSANPALVTVEADPGGDPNSALVKAVGGLTPDGSPVRITITADAKIGPEVVNIEDFVDVTVVAGDAVSLGLVAGTPAEQA